MNKLKLSAKISLLLCAALVVIFGILITISAVSSSNALKISSFGQMQAMTEKSGAEVEKLLSIAESTTKNMSNYMQTAYQKKGSSSSAANEATAFDETLKAAEGNPTFLNYIREQKRESDLKNTSEIFPDLVLSATNREIEDFLLETAKNAVLSNEDIVGVGALFEPYSFSDQRESYSLYVNASSNGGVEVSDMGDYSAYSNEDFYKSTIQNKSLTITEPYTDKTTGVQMITVLSPILLNGEIKGAISVDISVESFEKTALVSSEYDTIYSTLVNENDTLIYHSTNPEKVGLSNATTFLDSKNAQATAAKMASNSAFNIMCKNADAVNVYKFYTPIKAGNNTWWANATVEVSDVIDRAKSAAILLIVVSIIALLLLVTLTVLILRRQLKPIQGVVDAARQLAQGDLDISLAVLNEDEIGILSNAFNDTAAYLKHIIETIASILNQISDNHLDVEVDAEYRGAFEQIGTSMKRITANLNHVMSEIRQSSDQVSSGSDQVSSGAQALSQGATEQASSVEELAATINEISAQVKETAENAMDARQQMAAAENETLACNEQMREMIKAMDEISQKSIEIGKIIKTIEDIAFQTNILALNAAVEAARAGVAGKGFAVVADEVRNLASKSAEASNNTSSLIEGSIAAVEKGTRIANETAQSLLKVVDSSQSVSTTVEKISEATNSQATSIAQVTQGIDQISSVVQTNSATAEESAAASEELSGQAQMLKNLVGQFKLKDSDELSLTETPFIKNSDEVQFYSEGKY